ncbi:MAG: hypothetical protein PHN51_01335 [Candidatus Nanopelagicales bacterium]|nr:hypothetical protein [Candidatus Nanopelagicales bacterium]
MKFEATPRFDRDFLGLPSEHRRAFMSVVQQFHDGCVAFEASRQSSVWPSALHVRRMVSAPRVWEMTWSFASPDSRATFEFNERDGELLVRWRRIGNHAIYQNP